MSSKITDLEAKIQTLRKKKSASPKMPVTQGYNVTLVMVTDLISCIFVGLGLGVFFQKVFHTPPLLTAFFTLVGGIAGLYTTVRFAIKQDKK